MQIARLGECEIICVTGGVVAGLSSGPLWAAVGVDFTTQNYQCFKNEPGVVEVPLPLASVSKWLTASIATRYCNSHGVSLDTPVRDLITKWPRGSSARVVDLIFHTAGIPEYLWLLPESSFEVLTNRGIAEKILSQEMFSLNPSGNFKYSNSHSILLAHVVEILSGTSFEIILEKMSTDFDLASLQLWTRSTERKLGQVGLWDVEQTSGRLRQQPHRASSFGWSDAGIWISPEDGAKWLLSSLFQHFLEHTLIPYVSRHQGGPLVQEWSHVSKGKCWAWQTGALPGATCVLVVDLIRKSALLFMTTRGLQNFEWEILLHKLHEAHSLSELLHTTKPMGLQLGGA